MSFLLQYYQDREELVYHCQRLENEIAYLKRVDEDTSDLYECLDLTNDKIKHLDEKHKKWISEQIDIICSLMNKTLK